MGALSDKLGRKKVLMACSALFAVLTVPMFALLSGVLFTGVASTGFLVILGVWSLFGALLSMNGGTLPTFLCELFPTRVRFSGFALSFNSANALFGGTAPLIATWLIGATGSQAGPGLVPGLRRRRDARRHRDEHRRQGGLRPPGRIDPHTPGGSRAARRFPEPRAKELRP